MFPLYAIGCGVCSIGFILLVAFSVYFRLEKKRLQRRRARLQAEVEDLEQAVIERSQKDHDRDGILKNADQKSKEEIKQKNPSVIVQIEKEEEKPKTVKKVHFKDLSSLRESTVRSDREQAGKEDNLAKGNSQQIGNPLAVDITNFCIFLREYHAQMAASSTVGPSSPYQPGSLLRKFGGSSPPENARPLVDVLRLLAQEVLKETTHWLHPRNFGPGGPGASSLDIAAHLFLPYLNVSFSKSLEKMTINHLKKILDIPPTFEAHDFVESATEAHFLIFVAARKQMLEQTLEEDAVGKMVVYCSGEAQEAVSKACRLAIIRLHRIDGMEKGNLEERIKQDWNAGLQPTCIVSTLSTFHSIYPEEMEDIAAVAKKYSCWLHVDASAIGGFWLMPDFPKNGRSLLAKADSLLLELFDYSEGMKMIFLKTTAHWQPPVTSQETKSQKLFRLFSNFSLRGTEMTCGRLEHCFLTARGMHSRMQQHCPNLAVSALVARDSFFFQYKNPLLSKNEINVYTQRLFCHLQESRKFFFGCTMRHGWIVVVVRTMGGYTTPEQMSQMFDELKKLLDEFERTKDDPKRLPVPSWFVPMSHLQYDLLDDFVDGFV